MIPRRLQFLGLGVVIALLAVSLMIAIRPASDSLAPYSTAEAAGRPAEQGTGHAERPSSAPSRPGIGMSPMQTDSQPSSASSLLTSFDPALPINAPWQPPAEQAPLVAEQPTLTRHGLHALRSSRVDDPPIKLLGYGIVNGTQREVLPELLTVSSEPGAPVTFYASRLGTFSTGANHITVRADDTGIARVQFRVGNDPGTYPVYAVSPARTGRAEFHIEVEAN